MEMNKIFLLNGEIVWNTGKVASSRMTHIVYDGAPLKSRIDPSYFADKYGMPVGERRDRMPEPPTDSSDDNPDDDGKQKNSRRFFD